MDHVRSLSSTRTHRTALLTALLGVLAVPATAAASAGTTADPATAGSTATATTTTSTATATTADPAARCGVDLSAPVVRASIAKVPTVRLPDGTVLPWSTRGLQGDFDPCARISGVVLSVERATGSSPHQVMVFTKGRYVGTATERAHPFTSVAVARSTPDVLALDYRWLLADDPSASPSGASQVQLRWDGTRVVRSGQLPPPVTVPAEALLTARELGDGLTRTGGGTGVRPTAFDPCVGTAYPAERERVAGAWRRFGTMDGGTPVEGVGITEDVVQYSTAADAAEAVEGYRRVAAACTRSIEGTVTTTYEVVSSTPLVVRGTSTDSRWGSPVAPDYYAFPRVGGRLALVVAGASEGDIGVDGALRFAALARTHLEPAAG